MTMKQWRRCTCGNNACDWWIFSEQEINGNQNIAEFSKAIRLRNRGGRTWCCMTPREVKDIEADSIEEAMALLLVVVAAGEDQT